MTLRAIHWSDSDRYFGPFTYASSDWRKYAIVLGSGDDDDYPGCRLQISFGTRTVIVALPPIVKPQRERKFAHSWDAATVDRLGRNWYYEAHEREFGFSYSDGFLQVFRGARTMDSRTDRTWSKHLPWTQWRHVRHSLYDLQGDHFADMPEWGFRHKNGWTLKEAIEAACPAAAFAFKDYDGEALTATVRIEEREWRFGEGRFRWLSLFRKPKVERYIDIQFSGETGRRKGSWKGGTVGHSGPCADDELHEAAFRRYCAEHEMVFLGTAKEAQAS